MKNRIIENIIILSLIIIGLPLFVFACVGFVFSIFSILQNEFLLLFFISLFGILGYFGLCNFFFRRYEGDLKITFTFLVCGVLSLLVFSIWMEISILEVFNYTFDFNEIPENIFLVWFVVVSIYYTIAVGRKFYKKIHKEEAN